MSGRAGGLSLLRNTQTHLLEFFLKKIWLLKKIQRWKDQNLNIIYIKVIVQIVPIKVIFLLTTEKRLQTKQFDLFLTLYKIWCSLIWSTGARPVHLTLAEANCIDIVAADFKDQTSVHHIQQAAGENPLLVVGDVFCGRKAQLLQVHRPEQLLLVDHGAEVSIEQPAALRVTDCRCGTHLLPSVLELHLQVCHWIRDKRKHMSKPCLMYKSY